MAELTFSTWTQPSLRSTSCKSCKSFWPLISSPHAPFLLALARYLAMSVVKEPQKLQEAWGARQLGQRPYQIHTMGWGRPVAISPVLAWVVLLPHLTARPGSW